VNIFRGDRVKGRLRSTVSGNLGPKGTVEKQAVRQLGWFVRSLVVVWISVVRGPDTTADPHSHRCISTSGVVAW